MVLYHLSKGAVGVILLLSKVQQQELCHERGVQSESQKCTQGDLGAG